MSSAWVNPTTRFPWIRAASLASRSSRAHSSADGPAPRRTDRRGQYGRCADDPDDSPDRAAFATARWPGCGSESTSVTAARPRRVLLRWRSVVSIHRGSSGRYTTIRFTAASSRRDTPSTGSSTGRFAAFSISWLNPRAASEQGERI